MAQKGRQVPQLESFTFPDTGISVQLRKVSPLLRDDIDAQLRRTHPPPSPPVVADKAAAGFGGDKTATIVNEADPDYQTALLKWQLTHYQRVGDVMLDLGIKRYVECDVDTDRVAELRADMAALGVELDADDKVVYISRICIGTRSDLEDFSKALFQRTATEREAVEAHKATFRGALGDAADRQGTDAA